MLNQSVSQATGHWSSPRAPFRGGERLFHPKKITVQREDGKELGLAGERAMDQRRNRQRPIAQESRQRAETVALPTTNEVGLQASRLGAFGNRQRQQMGE